VGVFTGQIAVNPVIAPGVAGGAVVMDTARTWFPLVPQELPADTVIFPLTAEPVVDTVIEAPALFVMFHPAGKVQL
jgi:hypothetical protein